MPGTIDHVWATLEPDHELYETFYGAWWLQDEWDLQEFCWWWESNLPRWPRKAGRQESNGLRTQFAAFMRRQGYKRDDVEEALGYRPGASPPAIWDKARRYASWLGDQPVQVGGLDAAESWAQVRAKAAEQAGASAEQVEAVRRQVRAQLRTPRVVEAATAPAFGFPNDITATLLYGEPKQAALDRAEAELRRQLDKGALTLLKRPKHPRRDRDV